MLDLERTRRALTYFNRNRGMVEEWFPHIVGISTKNEFLPYYAAFGQAERIKGDNGRVNKIIYTLPKPLEGTRLGHLEKPLRTYNWLYRAMNHYKDAGVFMPASLRERPLLATVGTLYEHVGDELNVHLAVTARTKHLLSLNAGQYIDLNQVRIYVSSEFEYSKAFKSIRRKIFTDLTASIKKGVEIVIVNNVEQKCFSRPNVIPNFSTIEEMEEFLDSHNSIVYE